MEEEECIRALSQAAGETDYLQGSLRKTALARRGHVSRGCIGHNR